jgi:hypothetical protein
MYQPDIDQHLAVTIDPASGALSTILGSPYATLQGPISIAVDVTEKYLYLASHAASYLSGYTIDPSSGELCRRWLARRSGRMRDRRCNRGFARKFLVRSEWGLERCFGVQHQWGKWSADGNERVAVCGGNSSGVRSHTGQIR